MAKSENIDLEKTFCRTTTKVSTGRAKRARALEWFAERLGPGTGIVVAFLLIVILGSILSPYFLTQRNITNVLLQSAMLGVVSVGMTFAILTAGIDLSVGMVLSFCSSGLALR